MVLLALAAGCGSVACREQGERFRFSPCEVFRPRLASPLVDGRSGRLAIRNLSRHWIAVNLFSPSDTGAVTLSRRAAPGARVIPAGADGVPVLVGADWGVQVDGGCVRTLGDAAEWSAGAFQLTWRGWPRSNFRPTPGTTAPQP